MKHLSNKKNKIHVPPIDVAHEELNKKAAEDENWKRLRKYITTKLEQSSVPLSIGDMAMALKSPRDRSLIHFVAIRMKKEGLIIENPNHQFLLE